MTRSDKGHHAPPAGAASAIEDDLGIEAVAAGLKKASTRTASAKSFVPNTAVARRKAAVAAPSAVAVKEDPSGPREGRPPARGAHRQGGVGSLVAAGSVVAGPLSLGPRAVQRTSLRGAAGGPISSASGGAPSGGLGGGPPRDAMGGAVPYKGDGSPWREHGGSLSMAALQRHMPIDCTHESVQKAPSPGTSPIVDDALPGDLDAVFPPHALVLLQIPSEAPLPAGRADEAADGDFGEIVLYRSGKIVLYRRGVPYVACPSSSSSSAANATAARLRTGTQHVFALNTQPASCAGTSMDLGAICNQVIFSAPPINDERRA